MYDSLIDGSAQAASLLVVLALAYLLLGLVRPSWAWAAKRRSVVLRTLAAIFLAGAGYASVIAYTHAQPDGPHSLEGYLKSVPPEQWEEWRKGN